jgi:uncharacterized protein YndB with AHSA1/START domain
VPDISESIEVAALPLVAYERVSELPRMPEWSPECTRVSWRTPGARGVGSRFIGHNRAGAIRWFTQGEVVEAVPGERFSFRIGFGPMPIAVWTYEFAAAGAEGCTVTESVTDRRPAAMKAAFGWMFGDRARINSYGIHKTLGNLKLSLEAAS